MEPLLKLGTLLTVLRYVMSSTHKTSRSFCLYQLARSCHLADRTSQKASKTPQQADNRQEPCSQKADSVGSYNKKGTGTWTAAPAAGLGKIPQKANDRQETCSQKANSAGNCSAEGTGTWTAAPAAGPGRYSCALLTKSSKMRLGRSCWWSLLATARLGSATTQLASSVRA